MKIKKRPITLLEIMIVIFLISIIGSVIGYNMKRSLDKGRAFKTQQAISQIEDILQLQMVEENRTRKEVAADASNVLKNSGLVKNPNKLLTDGWNNKLKITVDDDDFIITSKKYDEYCKKHNISNG